MKKLFGTDGIRGLAGKPPLTPADVRLLGEAAGTVLRQHAAKRKTPRVFIVRDTRLSGRKIAENLSRGLRARGLHVYNGGVLSTPAAAYLVQAHKFDAAAVISASHNPPEFNGIKFFTPHGRKWPDAWEESVESYVHKNKANAGPSKTGRLVDAEDLGEDYEAFLISTLPAKTRFDGLKIGLDCSNGATHKSAPAVFRWLGARVYLFGADPTGTNINRGCGSQQTGALSRMVVKNRCHFGMAFDGDGDRVIFVNEKGQVLDGDGIVALLARHLKARKRLRKNLAVLTVMANLGLKKALETIGVRIVETPVGDRYVSEAMRKNGAVLGGEQSGHIILGEYLPTGDGLLTGLHLSALIAESGKPLSKLSSWVKKFPQTLLNVRVFEKKPIEQLNGVSKMIDSIKHELGNRGRVLVRYSGTEPLLRIMIEGPEKRTIDRMARNIADEVRTVIGA